MSIVGSVGCFFVFISTSSIFIGATFFIELILSPLLNPVKTKIMPPWMERDIKEASRSAFLCCL